MKNTDKVTMTFGQLKRMIKESKSTDMALKIGNDSPIYGEVSDIESVLSGNDIEDVIIELDGPEYYLDGEYHLYADYCPANGRIVEVDSEYIHSVKQLHRYINRAIADVNNKKFKYIAIETPNGSDLVQYGQARMFKKLI